MDNVSTLGTAINDGFAPDPADQAFDGSYASRALMTPNTSYLGRDFGESKTILEVDLSGSDDGNSANPVNFTFDVWNGSSWDVVHTVTGESWGTFAEVHHYVIDSPQAGTKFRIKTNSVVSNPSYVGISEMVLWAAAADVLGPDISEAQIHADGDKLLIQWADLSAEYNDLFTGGDVVLSGMEHGACTVTACSDMTAGLGTYTLSRVIYDDETLSVDCASGTVSDGFDNPNDAVEDEPVTNNSEQVFSEGGGAGSFMAFFF